MRKFSTGAAAPAVLTAVLSIAAPAMADVHATPRPAAMTTGLDATPPAEAGPAKLAALSSADRHAGDLEELSDRIWAYAEIALREHKCAAALADYAEKQGCRVQRGAAGHGCVHNMFGAASLGAAIAIKEQIAAAAYTEQEHAFAEEIQRATGVPEVGMFDGVKPLEGQPQEGGSTDVGDVSWIVPTLHVSVATAPVDAPWHGWPVVATGGMSIGHKGMLRAAKVVAATMVDLYERPEALAAVRAEFKAARGDVAYQSYVPSGPPPVPGD